MSRAWAGIVKVLSRSDVGYGPTHSSRALLNVFFCPFLCIGGAVSRNVPFSTLFSLLEFLSQKAKPLVCRRLEHTVDFARTTKHGFIFDNTSYGHLLGCFFESEDDLSDDDVPPWDDEETSSVECSAASDKDEASAHGGGLQPAECFGKYHTSPKFHSNARKQMRRKTKSFMLRLYGE